MKIEFDNVVPYPMKSWKLSSESAWGSAINMDHGTHYFLQSASGKGKSTFIAYILGLRKDYSGSILIDGKNQKNLSLDDWSDLRSQKLAFVAQDMRLFPNLTAWENLQIKNKLNDFKTESEIDHFLEQMEIDQQKNQLAGTLSLGQQQRFSLVRSLLQPFEMLIMDEPFSHIDEGNIDRAIKLITAECERQKAGYLMTTLGYDYGITNAVQLKL